MINKDHMADIDESKHLLDDTNCEEQRHILVGIQNCLLIFYINDLTNNPQHFMKAYTCIMFCWIEAYAVKEAHLLFF